MKSNFISFEHSGWFILLVILLAGIFSFALYYKDTKLKHISRGKLYLLATLRFLYVFLIAFLLLNPLFKTFSYKTEQPVIVVVQDNSRSIKYACKNNPKFDSTIKKIQNQLKLLQQYYRLDKFSFGNKIIDSLLFDFSENKTDFSKIIDYVSKQYYTRNIGALILISDGIYNYGSDPVYLSKSLNYPVYTVLIGDSTSYFDIAVDDIEYNDFAYLNSKFSVKVAVKAQKLKNKNAKINLIYGSKIIESKQFNINSNDYYHNFEFSIDAKKEGIHKYKVQVTYFSKEKNIKNNVKFFAVNVIKNQKKILILANSPNPDIAALYNALKRNKNYNIDVAFIDKIDSIKIQNYSLCILHNLPADKNVFIRNFYPKLKKSAIPIIFVCGSQTNLAKINQLKLGVNFSQQKKSFDYANAVVNKNFNDFEISKDLQKLFESSPPFFVPFADVSIDNNFKIIFYQKINGIKTKKPLIFSAPFNQNYSAGVSFVFGENIWMSRIYDYKQNSDFDIFDNFINRLVEYTSSRNPKNRLIIKVDKIIPSSSEVRLSAELYNKIFELVNTPDLKLTITDSNGNSFDYVFQRTDNTYKINLGNFAPGQYSYKAYTNLSGETLKNTGSFYVVKTNSEALDLTARYDVMYKIAENSGGNFIPPDKIDSLYQIIRNAPNIKPMQYSSFDISELISFKWLFGVILLLMSLEWLLRKLFGTF